MSTTSTSQPASGGVRVNGHSPWVWALQRTAMGILIMAVVIGGTAWLMSAAIDLDRAATAGTQQQAAQPDAVTR
jgi:hypothetical protein